MRYFYVNNSFEVEMSLISIYCYILLGQPTFPLIKSSARGPDQGPTSMCDVDLVQMENINCEQIFLTILVTIVFHLFGSIYILFYIHYKIDGNCK